MSEPRQIATLIAISLVIAVGMSLFSLFVVPALVEGDLVIDRYDANYDLGGNLSEQYLFDVHTSGEYRMLFRNWVAPLSLSPLTMPYVQFIGLSNPPGTTGYVKDYQGAAKIVGSGGDPSAVGIVRQLALPSEVGIYNPSYFNAGTYALAVNYQVHPPVEYDETDAHVNIRLADNHIPYRQIRISIPAQYVEEVFPYPTHLQVIRDGSTILLEGSAARDEIVGFELVLSKDALPLMDSFQTYVQGVKGKTEAANPFWNNIPYPAAWVLLILGAIAVFATSVVFLWMYYRYGQEKQFTVPRYLSFVPDPGKKPWVVNLLFKGDAMTFDEDGYYATLLDLHRRNFIRITEREQGGGVRIQLLRETSDDPYEQRVIGFLRDVGEGGVMDTSDLQQLAESAKTDTGARSRILKYQGNSVVSRGEWIPSLSTAIS